MGRSEAIAKLNKYDEKKPEVQVASGGTAFSQKGKKGNANKNKKNDAKTGDNKNEGRDSNITLPARIVLFVERRATGKRNARREPTRTRRNRQTVCLHPAN